MSLDDFVDNLQAEIDTQALKDYGREAFERWKAPRWMGAMADADAHGQVTGTCGDTMQIFFKIADGLFSHRRLRAERDLRFVRRRNDLRPDPRRSGRF